MRLSSGKFAEYFNRMSELHSIYWEHRGTDVLFPVIFESDDINFQPKKDGGYAYESDNPCQSGHPRRRAG